MVAGRLRGEHQNSPLAIPTPRANSLLGAFGGANCWSLARGSKMSRFVPAAKVAEIPEESAKCVEVEGKRIALFNSGGEFYAIDDDCTHEGGPLSEGFLHDKEVECPWHGARFNLKSGEVTLDPAEEAVACYNVRITGDKVEIEI